MLKLNKTKKNYIILVDTWLLLLIGGYFSWHVVIAVDGWLFQLIRGYCCWLVVIL